MRKTLAIGIISIMLVTPALAIAPAATYCAQSRSAAGEQPNCTFNTLHSCRASLKAKGGGHCYRLHR